VATVGASAGFLRVDISNVGQADLVARQIEIIGVDHDPDRVRLAEAAALRIPVTSRPKFQVDDLREKLVSFASGSLAQRRV